MNGILRESGFDGFSLKVCDDKKTYKVIRPNDKINPAKGLSEGERNFISFLYFYFTVKGIKSDNGELPKNSMRDKIIVIDDPVSSMDSNVLFIVSGLMRELIDDCFHEGKQYQIKQSFILTHNAYFYLDIVNEWTNEYRKVSLFSVKKEHNVSTVNLCVREINNEHQKFENIAPVQNPYMNIWIEFKEVTSPTTLMNVIHRILTYYFIQLMNFKIGNLENIVMEYISEKDKNKLKIAKKMLSYIYENVKYPFDENYIDDNNDSDKVKEYKDIFKMCFEATKQMPHYKKMYNSVMEY